MKIELVKRVDISGETWYHVRMDGMSIIHSVTNDLKKAEEYFKKAQEKQLAPYEVIKSVEI